MTPAINRVPPIFRAPRRTSTQNMASCTLDSTNRRGQMPKGYAAWFTASTPTPALLHVSRESRFEALSIYTEAFKTCDSPRYTYVSFDRDTIRCLDVVLEYLVPEDVKEIQRIVVVVGDSAYFTHFHMETLQRMAKLEQLDLLTREALVYGWNRGSRYEVEILARDFEQGRWDNPAWECPRVCITNNASGEELKVIAGGALIPGWKEGDPNNI